ncbi:MAG: type III pantothenate kinase, partial [Gammaproteobacteria bacterium]|nr:type III pantothenate kinase [Gammaproteobacteria bacterium]
LLQQTAIPKDSTASVEDVLGRDTPTGVLLGSRYAAAAIAEMFLSGSRSLFPQQQAELYLGGGDADGIGDALSVPYTKLDHLVLRGIAVVALSGEV